MPTNTKISFFVSTLAMIFCAVMFQNCSEGFKSTTLSSSGNGTGGSGGLKAFSLETPPPGTSVSGQVLVSGTCEGTEPVTIGYGDVRDYARIDCVDGQFALEVSFPTSDGAMTLEARQKAPDGQERTSSSQVTKDTVAPVVSDTTPGNANKESKDNANGSIACEGNLPVQITGDVTGAPLISNCNNGSLSFSVPLEGEDGSKNVIFTQSDDAGNSNSVTLIYTKDTTAPVVEVTAPAANTEFSNSISVSGSCETGTVLNFSGSQVTGTDNVICSDSQFQTTVNFTTPLGAVTVTVTSTDAAGNSSQTQLNLTQVEGLVNVTSSTTDFQQLSDRTGAISLVFSEAVTGLESSDFQLTNATVTDLSGSGTSYTVSLRASSEGEFSATLPKGAAVSSGGNQSQQTTVHSGNYIPERTPTTVAWELVDAPEVDTITISETGTPMTFRFERQQISGTDHTVGLLVSECFGGDPETISLPQFSNRLTVIDRKMTASNKYPKPMPQALQVQGGAVGGTPVVIPAGRLQTDVEITPKPLTGFHNGIHCVVSFQQSVAVGAGTRHHKFLVQSTKTAPSVSASLATANINEGQTMGLQINLSSAYQFDETMNLRVYRSNSSMASLTATLTAGQLTHDFQNVIPDYGVFSDGAALGVSLTEVGAPPELALTPVNFNIIDITPMPTVSFKNPAITLSESLTLRFSDHLEYRGKTSIPFSFSWDFVDGTARKGGCSEASQHYVAPPTGYALTLSTSRHRDSDNDDGGGASTIPAGPPVVNYELPRDSYPFFTLRGCGDLVVNSSERKFQIRLKDYSKVAAGSIATVDVVIEDDDTPELKVTRVPGGQYPDVDISDDSSVLYALVGSSNSSPGGMKRFHVTPTHILFHRDLGTSPFERLNSFDLNGNEIYVTGGTARQYNTEPATTSGFRVYNTSTGWQPTASFVEQIAYYAGHVSSEGNLLGYSERAEPMTDAGGVTTYLDGRLSVYEKSAGTWSKALEIMAPNESESGRTTGPTFATNGTQFAVGHYNYNGVDVYRKVSGTWEKTKTLRGDLPSHASHGFAGLLGGGLAMSNDILVFHAVRYNDHRYFWYRWDGSEWILGGDLKDLAPTPTDIDSHHSMRWNLQGNKLTISYHDFETYHRTFIFRWNGSSWVADGDFMLPEFMAKAAWSGGTQNGPAHPFGDKMLLYPGAWVVKYE